MRRTYSITYKFIKLLFVSVILLFMVIAYQWESSDMNTKSIKKIHECIYDSKEKHFTVLNSMGNIFYVSHVTNSPQACINPFFPSIHISTDTKIDGWVHVVYTDSDKTDLQVFIDTKKNSSIYPFYTFSQDFYDAPMWKYKLFYRPITFWEAHAYAVQVNHNTNTVNTIGGIRWGFTLPYYKIRPSSIFPEALTNLDWEKDSKFFFSVCNR